MFTGIALLSIALIQGLSRVKERREGAVTPGIVERVLFIQKDVRLLAYLLMAILMMLGIIADRIH